MSNVKAFRFSAEVLGILDKQEDPKSYIESLVLGKAPSKETPNSSVMSEGRISYLLSKQTQEIIEALKEAKGSVPPSSKPFVPGPPDPIKGYPCCEMASPCKHWIFDGLGSTYMNTLTGELKDLDG